MKLPPSRLASPALALAAVLATAVACQGSISDKGAGADTGGGSNTPGGGSGQLCSAGQKAPPVAARVRRLTNAEVSNTLVDLLGADYGTLASGLEPDSRASGFSTGEERTVTSGYADSLKRLAESAAATFRTALVGGTATFKLDASCSATDAAA